MNGSWQAYWTANHPEQRWSAVCKDCGHFASVGMFLSITGAWQTASAVIGGAGVVWSVRRVSISLRPEKLLEKEGGVPVYAVKDL